MDTGYNFLRIYNSYSELEQATLIQDRFIVEKQITICSKFLWQKNKYNEIKNIK